MFPLWRKTAGSTNGHLLLQPNMKESLWAAMPFFFFFFFFFFLTGLLWDVETVAALSYSAVSNVKDDYWRERGADSEVIELLSRYVYCGSARQEKKNLQKYQL